MKIQLLRLAMVGVLIAGLSACEDDVTGPGSSDPDAETQFAVDADLTDGIITDILASFTAVEGGGAVAAAASLPSVPDPDAVEEARALVEMAREKFMAAREAFRAGNVEEAQQLALEGRLLLAEAMVLVFGDEAYERSLDRIDHLITWLEERVDGDNSELLIRIRQLRDEAVALWDEGDAIGAVERLLFARQIASRERAHHRRLDMAMHARLAMFMGASSIELASELIGDNPTERQAHELRFAANLLEDAGTAFEFGRPRLAFNLAREVVNISLVVVVHDPDMPEDGVVEAMIRIAEEQIAAAEEVVGGDDTFAARLLAEAKAIQSRGLELVDSDQPRRAVRVLWHAATLANGILFLVTDGATA